MILYPTTAEYIFFLRALGTFAEKEEKSQINNLTLQLEKNKLNPKAIRIKEIINITPSPKNLQTING